MSRKADGALPSRATARRRLLLVARGLDRVGTGVQIECAARALAPSGWEVHAAMLSGSGDLARRLADAGVEVHELTRRPALHDGCLPALFALLRRLRPTLVESWGWSASRAATLVGGLGGPPVACRVGTAPGASGRRRLVLRRADVVMTDSPALAEACRRHVRPETLLRVVPPAAPPPREPLDRTVLAQRLGLRAERPWTLCVAPIEAAARLEHLLFAIEQMEIVLPEIEHVLVGQGGQWPRIARRQRVQEIGDRLHRFETLEPVDRLVPHAALVWQAGDVALGGALLEGMVAGVPSVAVARPSTSALVADGRTGFLVAPEPAADLTRRAVEILESAGLAERLGREARAVAEGSFHPGAAAAAHAAVIAPFGPA